MFERSRKMYEKALNLIPWGVQTGSKRPDFLFFNDGPIYVKRAKGSRIWDVDGNEYIDYIMALGAVFLGYNVDEWIDHLKERMDEFILTSLSSYLEYELASEIVGFIPSVEMVRFFKTGAEATSAAVRLARYVTKRDGILACGYFGWHDWANRGGGIPKCVVEMTVRFEWDELGRVSELLRSGKFACVIVEPVMGDEPKREKLDFLRSLTRETGTLLIFDEIKTGFRFPEGSAQAHFKVFPDLTVLGKALANGMPLSALGGKREIMERMSDLWISTTYGSESLSIASALFTVSEIKKKVKKAWDLGEELMSGISKILERYGLDAEVVGYPTMFWVRFGVDDMEREFILGALRRGVLLKRGGYNFASLSHSSDEIERTLEVVEDVVKEMRENAKGWKKG